MNKWAIGVCKKTSLGCLLLTFHVRLGFVSLLACGGLCLLALAPGGGSLLSCFLFQHGPVKCVVILVIQSPKRHRNKFWLNIPIIQRSKWVVKGQTKRTKRERVKSDRSRAGYQHSIPLKPLLTRQNWNLRGHHFPNKKCCSARGLCKFWSGYVKN